MMCKGNYDTPLGDKCFLSHNLPLHDVLLLGRKAHAYAEKFPRIGSVRLGVATFFNLLESFGRCAIKFEFKNVYIVVCLNDDVGTTA